jgi:hypothetical protein
MTMTARDAPWQLLVAAGAPTTFANQSSPLSRMMATRFRIALTSLLSLAFTLTLMVRKY